MPNFGCWLVRLLERMADELKISREKMLGTAFNIAQDMARTEEKEGC